MNTDRTTRTTRLDLHNAVRLALRCAERGDLRAAREYAVEVRGVAADYIIGGGSAASAGAALNDLGSLRWARAA